MLGAFLTPPTFINADEYLYAGQARMLLGGEITWREGVPLPGGAQSVRYPFGWPLVLAPFAAAGFRALYYAPLVVHLLAAACLARILTRRGIHAAAVAVFLFHPVLWSFSRTIMSDAPAAAMLLIGIDAWENERHGRAGTLLGYSLFSRLAGIFAVFGVAVATYPTWRRNLRVCARIAVPVACAIALLVIQSLVTPGSPARSQYAARAISHLGTGLLLENAVLYGAGLALIPPFPLLALLLRPRRCDRWVLAGVPIVAFFCFYEYHEQSRRLLETFLGGQRLIIGAHVVMLVGTARVWSDFPLIRRRWLPVAAGMLGTFVHAAALRPLYARYAPAAGLIRSCAPDVVAYNMNAARVALANDALRYDVLDRVGLKPDADIAVIALSEPTNRPLSRPPDYVLPPELARRTAHCVQVGEFYLFDLTGRCEFPGGACDTLLPAGEAARQSPSSR